MRPVFQTHTEVMGNPPGNCMQAAVASFLNLPLEAVPDFIKRPDANAYMRAFMRTYGFRVVERPVDFVPPGYYFQTGTSVWGHEHIVVCRSGGLVHDPNPHGSGLMKADAVLWPRPLDDHALHIVMDAAPKRSKLEAPDVKLRPIHPNAGVQAWYREKLQHLARCMAIDILRRVKRKYRPVSNRIGMDDDPVVILRTVLRLWGRRWTKRFDQLSNDIAQMFATRSQVDLDAAFRRRLKEAGFTVSFRPTERMTSSYRAVVAENVGLIRSIPRQFLKDVESSVWTSAMRGAAMHELSTEIRAKYGVTYRRAALISRDQNAKARAVFEKARRVELGITEAIWQHSAAGKAPRPTHVKLSGTKFDVSKGAWDSAEQRFVQPGELINCRCTSRSILPNRLK